MKAFFNNISIKAISTALPKEKKNLHDFDNFFGHDEIEKIMASTGIYKVRESDKNTCTSDLCVVAANKLMSAKNISPDTIDGIVFVSQTPDYILPATSVILQDRLGLPRDAAVFDINHGCSGYIYGLYQASMMISTGGCRRVLVFVGDVSSRLVNERDRSTKMIFGNAASATLVESGSDAVHFLMKTDGSGANHLIVPAGGFRKPCTPETAIAIECEDGNFRSEDNIYMNSMEIMSFVIREIPAIVKELLEVCNWDKSEVGTFAFHQANKFILDFLRKQLRVSSEAVPVALAEIGNTSSASIPVMLSVEYNRLQQQNRLNKVAACGFGVGFSWGAAALNLSQTEIFAPVEV